MKTKGLEKASVDTFLKSSAFGQEMEGVVAVEKPEFKELKRKNNGRNRGMLIDRCE